MTKNKKIYILLPDGVGLRNFAYSNFYDEGRKRGFDSIYWNNTPFDLKSLGFEAINITHSKSNKRTEVYKNARKEIELNLFVQRTGDEVYNSYRFPFSYATLKKCVKSYYTRILIRRYNSEKGIEKLRSKIHDLEKQTVYYQECLKTLKEEKPSLVFCTNQRPMTAIAPVLAAKELGIPTVSFIFSWDNLPKATMVVEADYYSVWSEHMKKELLFYYPYIQEEQVFVTGTPQFETHFDASKIKTREAFFQEHQLDLTKKYICYSGDDVTTCPDDPQYLADVAEAVSKLNKEGNLLGIIFRRCPVDFSDRFDAVLGKYKEIITPIAPEWKKIGEGWNTILPTPSDLDLQVNTIYHTEMVVNLGSSMVFDYTTHQKACAFINYDVLHKKDKNWSVKKIYNYVHFRSMPQKKAVIWLNSADEIAAKINEGLNSETIIENAQKWFEIINQHPPDKASERIWNTIDKVIK